jgi:hypothetical protein
MLFVDATPAPDRPITQNYSHDDADMASLSSVHNLAAEADVNARIPSPVFISCNTEFSSQPASLAVFT